MSPTIETASGRGFNFLAPTPEMIDIDDIAHALSHLCRYTGHCREFYCPTPSQRILTADLRWEYAGNLRVGQELVGFDENPVQLGSAGNKRRRFRPCVVTHAQNVKRNVIMLEMSDGSTVESSVEHPWLVATKASRNQSWLTAAEIARDISLGRKRYMHKFSETWGDLGSRRAGWLAGVYDGEGHLCAENRKGTLLGVSQKPGLVLDEITSALCALGFPDYRLTPAGRGGVMVAQTGGGWREIMRLLGSIRPVRLLSKFQQLLRDGVFDKQMDGIGEPLEIVRAHHRGEQWVSGLGTSTHTYLCEGFGAHNSVAQHSVIVARYVEDRQPTSALRALLHDATEAYIGDVSRPLKQLLPEYQAIEARVAAVIDAKFGFDGPEPPIIKEADNVALVTEKRDLMSKYSGAQWQSVMHHRPLERQIAPLPPPLAREMFRQMFFRLSEKEHHTRLHGGWIAIGSVEGDPGAEMMS